MITQIIKTLNYSINYHKGDYRLGSYKVSILSSCLILHVKGHGVATNSPLHEGGFIISNIDLFDDEDGEEEEEDDDEDFFKHQQELENYDQVQRELCFNIISPTEQKIIFLQDKLRLCCVADVITRHFCKDCKDEGVYNLLKTTKQKYHCGVRYCFEIDCILERFVNNIESFDSIKRLKSLRKLWHCTIGFESIPVIDFINNFDKLKKRYEIIMRGLFSKLKKQNINLPHIRVLDFSFQGSLVYPHFHFGFIPPKSSELSATMKIIKKIEKGMKQNMRIKTPFHFQSFGYKNKGAIFAYFSKRCAGLYKFTEEKNIDWNTSKGKLRRDLEAGKYFGLKDVMDPKHYIKHFHNKKHYVTGGGLPHGSIPTDIEHFEDPLICEKHGVLTPHQIHTERELAPAPPPDDFKVELMNDVGFVPIVDMRATPDWKGMALERLRQHHKINRLLDYEASVLRSKQSEKRFSRVCNPSKIKLDVEDTIRLLAFGKC